MKSTSFNKWPIELLIAVLLTILVGLSSCNSDHSPKPSGFHRLNLPSTEYKTFTGECPFEFKQSVHSDIVIENRNRRVFCWFDLSYEDLKAEINVSYKPINNAKDLNRFTEDTYELSYKHTYKASLIEELPLHYPNKEVYGIFYGVAGNAASPFQFYLTDSSDHFLRASVYFNCPPNVDSLKPAINYIRDDLMKMIDSFEWKKEA